MGSSLGYGQGMEYQYFNAPQPSQPMPVLRQNRLQRLREERMRRQQGGPPDENSQGPKSLSERLSSLFSSPSGPAMPPAQVRPPQARPWETPQTAQDALPPM